MKLFLTQPGSYSHNVRNNFARVKRLLVPLRSNLKSNDVLLLPELIGGESNRDEYNGLATNLARDFECYVVAGSHHEHRDRAHFNCGAVANPNGKIICRYEKLRPYGIESQLGIIPGSLTGQFEVDGCRLLILICADFWYSEVFLSRLEPRPDVILVPTFSISSRATPRAAKSLWKSMAISRAYEFGVYVGISDWAYPSDYYGLKSSSVAGLADPRPHSHNGFFLSLGQRRIEHYPINVERVRELRQYRLTHAFLSDKRHALTDG